MYPCKTEGGKLSRRCNPHVDIIPIHGSGEQGRGDGAGGGGIVEGNIHTSDKKLRAS